MSNNLYEFGKLYHDYSIFGFESHQKEDVFFIIVIC